MWRRSPQPRSVLEDSLDYVHSPSLRGRFIVVGAFTIGLIAMIAIKLVFDYSERLADISYDRLLRSALLQIDENVGQSQGEISVDIPWSAFATLAQASDDRVFYKVESSDQGFITGYHDLDASPLLPVEQGTVQFFDRRYSGEIMRFAWLERYMTEPDASGTVRIVVAHTRLSREAMATSITQRAVHLIALVALVSIVLIVIGSQLVLRPLHRIEQQLEDRTPGDLTPLTLKTPRETYHLKMVINHFMERLQTNLAELENYTSNAAHQLRTPIASLKALAENARDIGKPEEQRAALEKIIGQCEALSDTVNFLLNQAVVSHRLQSQNMGLIDLVQPLQESCRAQALAAFRKGVMLSFEQEVESATIVGDTMAIEQMMQNLIENAVRYSLLEESSTPHEVVVRIVPRPNIYRVEVIDYGVGISDIDKERVFERFYRGRYDITGSGVGLSMVKDIADYHKASIQLQDTQPQGTTVIVDFPVYEMMGEQ
ncbi:sensor histidine kinase [Marinomonas ostreistagni]|uniref:sensor histidine kinase n=1 Tax=Marinomonas ostreistagni TaxID=359209 RepID=UPI00194FBEA9|nr:sensor histidine kinase [Marinomonas ostreistagni]MBM6551970.1 sensor histidine kinase [Marinomonas ostreistagni]